MRVALILVLLAALSLSQAEGAEVAPPAYWADWTSWNAATITTLEGVVGVTYDNPQGIAFAQTDGGTDFWLDQTGARDPATSPYTSDAVANIPTGTDIIALTNAGMQTITFSEPIANPVFAYVSLNGNGYAFDRDFEILSFGDPSDGNECGRWGCGTSFKEVVEVEGGGVEYRLLGTGEPHGTLRFVGTFTSVSWRSMSVEWWNGFTVGIGDSCVGGASNDFDQDGASDLCDEDDDGDCFTDAHEREKGSDPRNVLSLPTPAAPLVPPVEGARLASPVACPVPALA